MRIQGKKYKNEDVRFGFDKNIKIIDDEIKKIKRVIRTI
jgi:hypothetical protein